jgi:1-deoxy-D-xylulose 5-phosphate reductoisomerase
MTIFCLEDFKVQFEKLKKNNSYSSIEKDIVEYFFEKEIQHLTSGTRLNNSDDIPYIKKRLNGSGGFRVYFLLVVKDEKVYLMFIHPKTGSMGYENITDDSKALLYKRLLEFIKANSLYQVTIDNNKLIFKKQ